MKCQKQANKFGRSAIIMEVNPSHTFTAISSVLGSVSPNPISYNHPLPSVIVFGTENAIVEWGVISTWPYLVAPNGGRWIWP